MPPLHVVIAVNASEPSRFALEWAMRNFLRLPDHRVTLLTVVEPPVQAGYYYAASAAMYSPSFIDEVYRNAQDAATKVVRTFQSQLEAHFDVRRRPPSAWRAVARA